MPIAPKCFSTPSFVAAALALLFTITVAEAGPLRGADPEPARSPVVDSHPAADAALDFDGLGKKNIEMDPLPVGWTKVLIHKTFPESLVEYSHRLPEMTFSVQAMIPPPLEGITAEKIAEHALADVSHKATSLTLIDKAPKTINGLEGIQFTYRAILAGQDICMTNWVFACPAGWYELLVGGPGSEQRAVTAEANSVFSLFHLKDMVAARKAPALAAVPGYHSQTYDYAVELKSPGWKVSEPRDRERIIPDADFAAINGADTWMMVVPIWLAGQDIDDEVLARALLKRMSIDFDSISRPQKTTDGKAPGYLLSFARDVQGVRFNYLVKTIKAGGFAYLIPVWSSNIEKKAVVEEALASISFDSKATDLVVPELSTRERQLHALVFNDAGNVEMAHQQPAIAATLHAKAMDMHGDSIILENEVTDYLAAQQPKDALRAIHQYMDQFTTRPTLLSKAAMLEAEVGDVEKAATIYHQLFETRFENDGALESYVAILSRAKKFDEALAVVHKYREHADSLTSLILDSRINAIKGDYDTAIKLLKDRDDKAGFNGDVTFVLTENYLSAKRYEDALKSAQSMLAAGQASTSVYVMLADAQMGMKSYRDAKSTLEIAIKADPNSQLIQGLLRQVSSVLGQGDNGGIRSVIEAVVIPDAVLNPSAPGTQFGKDSNCYYTNVVTAVSFQAGKEQKTTEYVSVKVLNIAGVDQFNALTFPFDPVYEQIYLNRLDVKNEAGKVIASAGIDDCYVTDRPHAEAATYSKILNVPVPGLKPGYSLEVMTTRRDISPGDRMRYYQAPLAVSLPCAQNALIVRGNLDSIKAIVSNGPARETIDGAWCYRVTNPAPLRYEPMSEEFERFEPIVTLTDANAAWMEEAKSYLTTIADVLKPDDQATALATDITAGLDTPSEKTAAILRHVQDNYTYQAIEFGRRARIPNRPGDVIRNRYGDCKDHALLLHHLLNAAGVPAHLVLVRSRGVLASDAPSLNQFDHMIVYSPGTAGRADRWYDCTDKASDLSAGIPFALAEKTVLVLDPQNPRLATIPNYTATSSSVNITREVAVSESGDLTVHEVISNGGFYGTMLRDSVQHLEPKNRTNAIQDIVSPGLDLFVSDVRFSNIDRPDRPLIVDMNYVVHRRFTLAGDQFIGGLVAPWEHHFLSVDHLSEREMPFCTHFPVTFQSITTVSAPPNFRFSAIPKALTFANTFASGSMNLTKSDNSLREDFKVQIPSGHYPADVYEKIRECHLEVLAGLQQSVVLAKK